MTNAEEDLTIIEVGARSLGIELSPGQLAQFRRYQELLMAWNRKFNLTAVADSAGIQGRHFLDSLSCATVTGDLNGRSVIDIGSGAGFPGLPLKLLYPGCQLTLVESVSKKASFLEAVVSDLGLDDVAIHAERAETLGQDATHREGYDWAVGRAVAPLPILVEYLLPLVKPGGLALAQKGPKGPGEVEQARGAIERLGGGRVTVQGVSWEGGPGERYLILIEKVARTPATYPRRVGKPSKRPLG